MIHLTRFNGRPFIVNADLIKFVEQAPDTVITLLTGEKLIVRETVQDVLDRVHAFHLQSGRRVAQGIAEIPAAGSESNLRNEAAKSGTALPLASDLTEGE